MMINEQDPRFGTALEDCCHRVQGGESLASCLLDYPTEYREEIARLVPLSEQVALLARDPSPEFQSRLEEQLLARVDEAWKAQGRDWRSRFGLFFPLGPAFKSAVATLAVLLVLTLSGAGALNASAGSLPDSPLYGVKTAKEWVQMAMARDGEAKVDAHADQIAERGKELQKAVQEKKPPRVVGGLALALAQSTQKMVDQALDLQAKGRAPQATRVLAVLRTMGRQVDRLAAQAQPDSRPALHQLSSFLDRQEQRMLERGIGTPVR